MSEVLLLRARERNILVVDDDQDSLEIVTTALKWEGYRIFKAQSGPEALRILEEHVLDLVLMDINLPGMTGQEALSHVRRREKYVSVIFISGNTSTESVVQGLDAGADDYICKPFDPREMLARVRTQLRIKDLNEQLRMANERLKELVDIDDLTGLFNMRSLYQKLDFELDRATRFSRSVCVVMMDMDYFKSVNDGHDHLFGSYVLSEVGEIIRQNIRNIDIAARYGGDEFLIVLTETSHDGAMIFCERLRKAILGTLFKNGEDEISLTASLGFAITAVGDRNMDAKSLVRAADMCLYDAKRAGRNCVKSRQLAVGEIAGSQRQAG